MKRNDKILLLQKELEHLQQAEKYLEFSQTRAKRVIQQKNWTPEELERLESLTSRFARLSDLMIQKIMRLIDDLELITGGTLIDRIQRAEKREWVESANDLLQIRELRNVIAHEYAAEKMIDIYKAVSILTPKLLEIVPKVQKYGENLILKYSQV